MNKTKARTLILGGLLGASLLFSLGLAACGGAAAPAPAMTSAAIAATPYAGEGLMFGGAPMVFVPAGDFLMGSSDSDSQATSDEKPQHTVYLDAFWIDKLEMTNALYKKCVDAGKCNAPSSRSSAARGSYFGNSPFDNYPVIYLSWDDAQAYCAWAGERLPTEAEWEKAARGTDGRIYPWGNTFDQSLLNSAESDNGDTTAVGSYPAGASPYGALGMAGNAWEWVADWYDENYYASSPSGNPTGPASGQYHVLRGGSWYYESNGARAALRLWGGPNVTRGGGTGFRCARAAH